MILKRKEVFFFLLKVRVNNNYDYYQKKFDFTFTLFRYGQFRNVTFW